MSESHPVHLSTCPLVHLSTSHSSLLLLFILLLTSCRPDPRPAAPPAVAFYHWKTELAPDSLERAYLRDLDAGYLYVKAFDVDWDDASGQPVPLAQLQIDSAALPADLALIPTIFITNRAMQQLRESPVELARRIRAKIDERMRGRPYAEVQIDCDWTPGTRETYFRLLEELRTVLPPGTALSATIRLHQLRYTERTGVPPVDRGMLMFYNMGDLEDWAEPNSILNLEKATPYLDAEAYPLPLDLALPLFRWGVLFRQGRLTRLLNNLSADELADTAYFAPEGAGRYLVRESTYLGGHYLYRGDQLRLEQVTLDDLRAAARLLRGREWPTGWRLAFYHLDSVVLKPYDHASLRSLVDQLSP